MRNRPLRRKMNVDVMQSSLPKKLLQDSLFPQHRADLAHARVPGAITSCLDARIRALRLGIFQSRGAGLLEALRIVRDVDDIGELQYLIRLARRDDGLSRGQILVEFERAYIFAQRPCVKEVQAHIKLRRALKSTPGFSFPIQTNCHSGRAFAACST